MILLPYYKGPSKSDSWSESRSWSSWSWSSWSESWSGAWAESWSLFKSVSY